MSKKAIVLLSGGLDSTTCMGIAKEEGYELYALSFDYGQKHKFELGAARLVAKHYKVAKHLITTIRFSEERKFEPDHDHGYHEPDMQTLAAGALGQPVMGTFEGSALVDPARSVPKDGVRPGIAPTYVPGRNMIFLSFALGWADAIDAEAVFIGVNALDYSGYPDCRPKFIHAMQDAATLGTRSGTEGGGCLIKAPLVEMSKKEIVLKGLELGVPWPLTHSCYEPEPTAFKGAFTIPLACGKCDSCRIRRKGFEEAGLLDEIMYAP